MKCNRVVQTVDTHTAGAPTRVVYSPFISGKGDMEETRTYWEEHFDWLRKGVLQEPRGYKDLTGAALTGSSNEEAECGIIFLEPEGYMEMCGHALAGAAAAIYEVGLIETQGKTVTFDTVSGLSSVEVELSGGKVKDAMVTGVPSYKIGNVSIDIAGKSVGVQVAYSGNIFGLLNASEFDINLGPKHGSEWRDLGLRIREELNRAEKVQELLQGGEVSMVEFTTSSCNGEADFENVVVFGAGQIDREPCGSGMSAKLACLYAEDKLGVGDTLKVESIIGTTARATITKRVDNKGQEGVGSRRPLYSRISALCFRRRTSCLFPLGSHAEGGSDRAATPNRPWAM